MKQVRICWPNGCTDSEVTPHETLDAFTNERFGSALVDFAARGGSVEFVGASEETEESVVTEEPVVTEETVPVAEVIETPPADA